MRIVDEDWNIRTAAGARVVVGRYGFMADGTDAEEIVFRQAATFVWALTAAGPRVVHLRLSNSCDVPLRRDFLRAGRGRHLLHHRRVYVVRYGGPP